MYDADGDGGRFITALRAFRLPPVSLSLPVFLAFTSCDFSTGLPHVKAEHVIAAIAADERLQALTEQSVCIAEMVRSRRRECDAGRLCLCVCVSVCLCDRRRLLCVVVFLRRSTPCTARSPCGCSKIEASCCMRQAMSVQHSAWRRSRVSRRSSAAPSLEISTSARHEAGWSAQRDSAHSQRDGLFETGPPSQRRPQAPSV